jgi:hypothetical protein
MGKIGLTRVAAAADLSWKKRGGGPRLFGEAARIFAEIDRAEGQLRRIVAASERERSRILSSIEPQRIEAERLRLEIQQLREAARIAADDAENAEERARLAKVDYAVTVRAHRATRAILRSLRDDDTLLAAFGLPPVPAAVFSYHYWDRLPSAPGVYFAWDGSPSSRRLAYVGQSVQLRERVCGSHEKLVQSDWVSYLEFPHELLDYAEHVYISVGWPMRNYVSRRPRPDARPHPSFFPGWFRRQESQDLAESMLAEIATSKLGGKKSRWRETIVRISDSLDVPLREIGLAARSRLFDCAAALLLSLFEEFAAGRPQTKSEQIPPEKGSGEGSQLGGESCR